MAAQVGTYPIREQIQLLVFDPVFHIASGTVLLAVELLVAGCFPMDADPHTKTPTTSCNIHTAAGVVMLLSLIIVPVFSLFTEVPIVFKHFTGACLIAFVIFTVLMGKAYNALGKIGLYQRLSYGAQLVWLAGYSVILSGF